MSETRTFETLYKMYLETYNEKIAMILDNYFYWEFKRAEKERKLYE